MVFIHENYIFFSIPQSCKAVSPQIAVAILAACNQRVLFHFLLLDRPATDPKLLQASDRPNCGEIYPCPRKSEDSISLRLQERSISLLGESCGERWLGKGGRDVRGQGTGASAASVRDGGGMCQPLTRPPSETESWI